MKDLGKLAIADGWLYDRVVQSYTRDVESETREHVLEMGKKLEASDRENIANLFTRGNVLTNATNVFTLNYVAAQDIAKMLEGHSSDDIAPHARKNIQYTADAYQRFSTFGNSFMAMEDPQPSYVGPMIIGAFDEPVQLVAPTIAAMRNVTAELARASTQQRTRAPTMMDHIMQGDDALSKGISVLREQTRIYEGVAPQIYQRALSDLFQ